MSPAEVVLRAPAVGEVPVVSPASLLPAKSMPQGNKAVLLTGPGSQGPATPALQQLNPKSNQALPAIVRPQAGSGNVEGNFSPQVKAVHPDISLPTEVPIVKQAMPGRASPTGQKQDESAVKVTAGPSQTIVAGPKADVPVIRVGTNSIPVVKPEGLMQRPSSQPKSNETLAAGNPQEPAIRGNERPEIALPPIKPGQEFPRTPKKGVSANPSVQQASSGSKAEMNFESVPVGTGAGSSQEPNSQPTLVQPAAPLLEQDFAQRSNSPVVDQHAHQHDHEHDHSQDHIHSQSELTISEQEAGQGIVGESYLDSHAHGDCQHCGGAGCSHCGLGGWNSLGNRSMLNLSGNCDNGCFGLLPCAQNYFIADVLYWTRNGGNVLGTDFGGVYDYDWNFGTQITMGTRVDPLYGHELTYFGLFGLDAGNTDVSPAGDIDARFTPGGGLTFADTSAFFDAVETTQTASSSLSSFQVNRVRLGWDVVQSHLGLRYIRFDEDYLLQSRNLGGDTGSLSLDARNNLIGPEVGIKLFYDVGRRISFSTHWKLGGYLNAYRTSTFLQNNGITRVNNSDSGTGFAASFDLGANAHIHLTQRLRLRGGYGILWLWDVASVTGNFPSSLTPASGTSTNDSENAIFHGANVGFEYYW
ncbi:MAG: hypothetical protein ACKO9H_18325 [Planctomycetota bacterium]